MEKTTNKKFKTGGIILSIIFIIIGILMLSIPAKMTVFNAWFILGTLIVNGIYKLILYFVMPKETRSGRILADGIISTLLGVLILADLLITPIAVTIGIIGGMGYMLGFYELFIGISQLCSLGDARDAGRSVGLLVFLGILNIICGMFVTAHPIISAFALEWVLAIYLVVFGVSKLIESICE